MRRRSLSLLCIGFLVLILSRCDAQESFDPANIALFAPNVPRDTLIIGKPFRLNFRATHSGPIDGVRVSLSYSQENPEAAYIDLLIDNVSRSKVMVVDTTLLLPNNAQPSAIVGRKCELRLHALVRDGRSGIATFIPLK